jgi:hypothetical protein
MQIYNLVGTLIARCHDTQHNETESKGLIYDTQHTRQSE